MFTSKAVVNNVGVIGIPLAFLMTPRHPLLQSGAWPVW